MTLLPIHDFAESGINSDLPEWSLKPGAITYGENFRVKNGKVGNFGSYEDWNTPTGAPSSFNPGYGLRVKGSSDFIITAGRTAVYVFDGSSFSDISNVAGYTGISTDDELSWTGCMLGQIPVINNPAAYPEYWSPQSTTQVMQDIPFVNTVSTFRSLAYHCKAMRSHKNFLIAMNLTEGGNDEIDAYRWSHPADTNSLPFTWDEGDPTNLAGKASLGGDGGPIIDGLSLRDAFAIYSETAIDILDYTGDSFVFERRELSSTIGLLARRGIAEIKGTHFIIADGDIVSNDGNKIQSIVHKRIRSRLNANTEADSYANSFALSNIAAKEIWFFVPESGATHPNVVYIYNWRDDSWSIKDVPDVAHAVYAPRAAPSDTWNTIAGTWATVTGVWGSRKRTPNDDTIIGIENSPTVINLLDEVTTATGVEQTIIERTGLRLTSDDSINTLNRIYPRIEGSATVSIQVGAQEFPGGPVTWTTAQDFNPATDRKLDVRSTGKLHCWKMTSTEATQWWLSSMDFEFVSDGRR